MPAVFTRTVPITRSVRRTTSPTTTTRQPKWREWSRSTVPNATTAVSPVLRLVAGSMSAAVSARCHPLFSMTSPFRITLSSSEAIACVGRHVTSYMMPGYTRSNQRTETIRVSAGDVANFATPAWDAGARRRPTASSVKSAHYSSTRLSLVFYPFLCIFRCSTGLRGRVSREAAFQWAGRRPEGLLGGGSKRHCWTEADNRDSDWNRVLPRRGHRGIHNYLQMEEGP